MRPVAIVIACGLIAIIAVSLYPPMIERRAYNREGVDVEVGRRFLLTAHPDESRSFIATIRPNWARVILE